MGGEGRMMGGDGREGSNKKQCSDLELLSSDSG